MAASEALAIERLGRGDVDGGLALSDAAGWNQTADDWSFFIDAGDALGIRDAAGRLIATAAALPYDAAVGWISMVLVDPAHRHRGLASRLVDECVALLRRRGCTPVLDATPAGAEVYARIGFAAGFAFERWESESGTGVSADAATTPAFRAGVDLHERDDVIALDHDATGIDRAALLRAFLARAATRASVAPARDGFALRRAGRRAEQVGPVVAPDDERAQALVTAALADVAGRVFIDVPGHCAALGRWLAERGFVRQRAFVRMALGDARLAAARLRVYALAGPEFG